MEIKSITVVVLYQPANHRYVQILYIISGRYNLHVTTISHINRIAIPLNNSYVRPIKAHLPRHTVNVRQIHEQLNLPHNIVHHQIMDLKSVVDKWQVQPQVKLCLRVLITHQFI